MTQNIIDIVAKLQVQGLDQVSRQINESLTNRKVGVDVAIASGSKAGVEALNTSLGNLNATLLRIHNSSASATATLSAISPGARAAANSLQQLAASGGSAAATMRNVSQSFSQAENSLNSFSFQTGLAARRFVAFTLGAGALIKLSQGFRVGLTEGIAFQDQLVRIAQVSGDSAGKLRALGVEITNLATAYGVSSRDLTKAALTLKQAGLSAKDTGISLEALAKAARAPNFDSMNQTAEGAIAILAQFKVGAEGLEGALGSMNAVAGEFAVEASDLITLVQKAGGTFKAAGGDLNELLGIFTAVRATTRESADQISTGLRTIFGRLQNNDVVESLKEMRIQLRYTAEEAQQLGDPKLLNQFVGAFEAFRRISAGAANIPTTDPKFAQLVETIGGSRQLSRVIPAIREFATAQKAVQVANAGTISLNLATEKSQESLQVQIDKTREKFLELFRSITNDKSFDGVLRGVLKITDAFIDMASSIKPILPLIGAIAASSAIRGLTNGGLSYLSKGAFTGGAKRYAEGDLVKGAGNDDNVRAILTPGEFIFSRTAVQRIGVDRLRDLHERGKAGQVGARRYAGGGQVQRFAGGGSVGDDFSSAKSVKEQLELLLGEGKLGSHVRKLALKTARGDEDIASDLTTGLAEKVSSGKFGFDSSKGGDIKKYIHEIFRNAAKTARRQEVGQRTGRQSPEGELHTIGEDLSKELEGLLSGNLSTNAASPIANEIHARRTNPKIPEAAAITLKEGSQYFAKGKEVTGFRDEIKKAVSSDSIREDTSDFISDSARSPSGVRGGANEPSEILIRQRQAQREAQEAAEIIKQAKATAKGKSSGLGANVTRNLNLLGPGDAVFDALHASSSGGGGKLPPTVTAASAFPEPDPENSKNSGKLLAARVSSTSANDDLLAKTRLRVANSKLNILNPQSGFASENALRAQSANAQLKFAPLDEPTKEIQSPEQRTQAPQKTNAVGGQDAQELLDKRINTHVGNAIRSRGGEDKLSLETQDAIKSKTTKEQYDKTLRELIAAEQRNIEALNKGISSNESYRKAKERATAAFTEEGRVAGIRVTTDKAGRISGTTTTVSQLANSNPTYTPTGQTSLRQNAGNFFKGNGVTGSGRISNFLNSPNAAALGVAGAFALPLAAHGIEARGGTANDAVTTGNSGRFKAAQAGSAALSYGAAGAFAGAQVGGGPGAAIGAVVGAGAGIAGALRAAAEEIRNVKIENALSGFQEGLARISAVVGKVNVGDITEISNRLNERKSLTTEKNRSESTSLFGGFDESEFQSRQKRSTRQDFGGQLPQLTSLLASQAERIGHANADIGKNLEKLSKELETGNNGLNREFLKIVASIRGVSIGQVLKELEKNIKAGSDAERFKGDARKSDQSSSDTIGAFGRLTLSVQSASEAIHKLRDQAALTADLFHGNVSGGRVNAHADRLENFGRNDAGLVGTLQTVRAAGGEQGESLLKFGTVLDKIASALPDILAKAASRGVDGADVGETVRTELTKSLGYEPGKAPKEADQVISQLVDKLNKDVGDKPGAFKESVGIDSTALTDKILAPLTGPLRDAGQRIAKQLEDNANQFSDGLAHFTQLLQETRELKVQGVASSVQEQTVRAGFEAQRRGEDNSVGLNGVSLYSLQRPQNERLSQLQTNSGLSLDDSDNPTTIGRRLATSKQDIVGAQANLQKEFEQDPTSQATKDAAIELNRLKDGTSGLIASLKQLSNGAQQAAAAQQKLSHVEAEQGNRRGLTESFYGASSEERQSITRGAVLTKQAHESGSLDKFSVGQQQLILQTLNRLQGITLKGLKDERGTPLTGQAVKNRLLENSAGGKVLGLDSQQKGDLDSLQSTIQSHFATATKANEELVKHQETQASTFFGQLGQTHETFFARLATEFAKDKSNDQKRELGRKSAQLPDAAQAVVRGKTLTQNGINDTNLGQYANDDFVKKVDKARNAQQEVEGIHSKIKSTKESLSGIDLSQIRENHDAPITGNVEASGTLKKQLESSSAANGLNEKEQGDISRRFNVLLRSSNTQKRRAGTIGSETAADRETRHRGLFNQSIEDSVSGATNSVGITNKEALFGLPKNTEKSTLEKAEESRNSAFRDIGAHGINLSKSNSSDLGSLKDSLEHFSKPGRTIKGATEEHEGLKSTIDSLRSSDISSAKSDRPLNITRRSFGGSAILPRHDSSVNSAEIGTPDRVQNILDTYGAGGTNEDSKRKDLEFGLLKSDKLRDARGKARDGSRAAKLDISRENGNRNQQVYSTFGDTDGVAKVKSDLYAKGDAIGQGQGGIRTKYSNPENDPNYEVEQSQSLRSNARAAQIKNFGSGSVEASDKAKLQRAVDFDNKKDATKAAIAASKARKAATAARIRGESGSPVAVDSVTGIPATSSAAPASAATSGYQDRVDNILNTFGAGGSREDSKRKDLEFGLLKNDRLKDARGKEQDGSRAAKLDISRESGDKNQQTYSTFGDTDALRKIKDDLYTKGMSIGKGPGGIRTKYSNPEADPNYEVEQAQALRSNARTAQAKHFGPESVEASDKAKLQRAVDFDNKKDATKAAIAASKAAKSEKAARIREGAAGTPEGSDLAATEGTGIPLTPESREAVKASAQAKNQGRLDAKQNAADKLAAHAAEFPNSQAAKTLAARANKEAGTGGSVRGSSGTTGPQASYSDIASGEFNTIGAAARLEDPGAAFGAGKPGFSEQGRFAGAAAQNRFAFNRRQASNDSGYQDSLNKGFKGKYGIPFSPSSGASAPVPNQPQFSVPAEAAPQNRSAARNAQSGGDGNSSNELSKVTTGFASFSSSVKLLSDSFSRFEASAKSLSESLASMPSSIRLEGQQEVVVHLNGADALAQLEPVIKEWIEQGTTRKISQTLKEHFPDVSPPRG